MTHSSPEDSLPLSEVVDFISNYKSLEMATLDKDGFPDISYTPYVNDKLDAFYIFVSQLAKHTHNLESNPVASVMFIEEERAVQQIFARQRVIIRCRVEPYSKIKEQDRVAWLDAFETRHGSILKMLRSLPDFQLFRLKPFSVNFIRGFGQAYRAQIDAEGMWPETLRQVRSR